MIKLFFVFSIFDIVSIKFNFSFDHKEQPMLITLSILSDFSKIVLHISLKTTTL